MALAALFAVLTPPAQADNFSGTTGGTNCTNNQADNRDHFIFNTNLIADSATAMAWARTNNVDPTVMNTYNETNGLTTSTDVEIRDADYEGTVCGSTFQSDPNVVSGAFAIARCFYLTSSGKCDGFLIELDNDFFGPRSAEAEAKVSCHELGHTLGLKHRTMDTSCMQSPWNNTATNRWYDDHDKAHIPNN